MAGNRLWLGALILLLGGCVAAHREVRIDALSAPRSWQGASYYLLSGDKETQTSDLLFVDLARYVHCILEDAGFRRAATLKEADQVVAFEFDISEPRERPFTVTTPIHGKTGVRKEVVRLPGDPPRYTKRYYDTYGVVGYDVEHGVEVTFHRHFSLEAWDGPAYRKNGQELELWKIDATSTGASGDLRRVFPTMAAAAKPFLGGNTGRQINLKLTPEDEQRSLVRCPPPR